MRIVFLISILSQLICNAQTKIEGRIKPTQDTIYLNEGLQVDYYSNKRLRDGFAHFPMPIKLKDSLSEYIVCAGYNDSVPNWHYISCGVFNFKKPGWNKAPRVWFKYKELDTIYSSNEIKVFVLNKKLDEKLIYRKNYLKKYFADSLSRIRKQRAEVIYDSLVKIRCLSDKIYLFTKKSEYSVGENETIEIEYVTNYMCLNMDEEVKISKNKLTQSSDHIPERRPMMIPNQNYEISYGNIREFKTDLFTKSDVLEVVESWNERPRICVYAWHYYEKVDFLQIIKDVSNYERITRKIIKVKFKKKGKYSFKSELIDSEGGKIANNLIKVIVK